MTIKGSIQVIETEAVFCLCVALIFHSPRVNLRDSSGQRDALISPADVSYANRAAVVVGSPSAHGEKEH